MTRDRGGEETVTSTHSGWRGRRWRWSVQQTKSTRAVELWRSARKRTRGSARGQANSLSKTRARMKRRRRAMECHGDRKRRTRESNVALQDLEKTTLSTRAARGGGRQWCWETTRPRASEHDWMMLETRSQKVGRGQRTVYEMCVFFVLLMCVCVCVVHVCVCVCFFLCCLCVFFCVVHVCLFGSCVFFLVRVFFLFVFFFLLVCFFCSCVFFFCSCFFFVPVFFFCSCVFFFVFFFLFMCFFVVLPSFVPSFLRSFHSDTPQATRSTARRVSQECLTRVVCSRFSKQVALAPPSAVLRLASPRPLGPSWRVPTVSSVTYAYLAGWSALLLRTGSSRRS